MSDSMLCIGILADTSLQQHSLRTVIEGSGYTVAVSRSSQITKEELNDLAERKVDAWVVDLDLTSLEIEHLDTWLNSINTPVIFGDGSAPTPVSADYLAWSRRLREKLQQLQGTINLEQLSHQATQRLWVLSASTGGPKAVNTFLCSLPPNIGVGFVYVQHIDAEFDQTLARIIVKGSHYTARVARHGDIVTDNTIIVIATEQCVEVLKNGTLGVSDKPWSGPYQPSINQVVANVAHTYSDRSGVIIFTGMGNDGASSTRLMSQQGGQVWVQTPATCVCTSMPDSAIKMGCVNYLGAPQDLAVQLVKFNKQTANGQRVRKSREQR